MKLRLTKTRKVLAAIVLVAGGFVLGWSLAPAPAPAGSAPASDDGAASEERTIWTCSMHPQVRLPEPGRCPICGMDLVPASKGEDGEDARTLRLSKSAVERAEIDTAPVERRNVAHEIDMVGKVAVDETRISYITAWVPGRLDRVYVDFTGVPVRAGDHLVELYSPRLYGAQQEYLQAIETASRRDSGGVEALRGSRERTLRSAREKLRLLGLNEDQIERIEARGTAQEHTTLLAPASGIVIDKRAVEGMYVDEGAPLYTVADLSKVWVLLDAYESDLAWLRYGQSVEFRVGAFPGERFEGRIAFIDPVLNDRTRTVKVRLNVENPDRRLKPDMFVSASAHAVLTPGGNVVAPELASKWICSMHPEVIADAPDDCSECGMPLVQAGELGFVAESREGPTLVIPDSAPLVTGKRAVVYVRVPDREVPTFEGREIVLGPRAGDWYVVAEGLAEGEEVVTRGNFKLDSELQIRAKPSMMTNPGSQGPSGGSDAKAHAGHASFGAAPGAAAATWRPPHGTPEGFRGQVGEVVAAYLALQSSLAADEDGADEALALARALARLDANELDADAREAWRQRGTALLESAEAVRSAEGADARRAGLQALTEALLAVLDVFGYELEGEDEAVGLFHCPMARDGEGGDWLQLGEETRNPYMGSAMPRCGERTRVVPSGL